MLEPHEGSFDEEYMKKEVMWLARGKLFFVRPTELQGAAQSFPLTSLAAMLDVLVNIDYEPSDAALQLQLDLISQHMRSLYSVPPTRYNVVSGYPSEPLLAEVATYQLYSFIKKEPRKDVLIESLTKAFHWKTHTPWLVHRRRRDEALVRLWIITAYLLAVATPKEGDSGRKLEFYAQPIFSRGADLISFFEQLFPKDVADEVLDSFPMYGATGIPLRECFKDAAIRITHFARVEDEHATTVYGMKLAMLRGAGFIYEVGDDIVDVMIPILLDKNAPITIDNLSAIMWRVRRCHSSGLPDMPDWELFPPGLENRNVPYISILSDVGAWSNTRKPNKESVGDHKHLVIDAC